jgi:hypothetical protein
MNNEKPLPEIDNVQLLAYIDGETDPEITTQIEQSEVLLARVLQLRQEKERLTAVFYRFDCPDSDELGDYYLENLSSQQAKQIAEHVSECPHCTRELAYFQEVLGEEKPKTDSGFLKQANVLIARLVSGLTGSRPHTQPNLTPAFGLRGAESKAMIYEVGDIQISINIQDDQEKHLEHKTLIGLIVGGVQTARFNVSLLLEDKEITATQVDDFGNFTLSGLPQATYHLIISSTEVQIHIQELVV